VGEFLIGTFLFVVWMLVGFVVVETCRLWRVWWLDSLSFSQALLWPLVLALTIINGPDQ